MIEVSQLPPIKAWSLVKSFYPWTRDVWSHAIFFTGVKCSYEFQLRWSEQGNVKSKGISNEEVVCTEIGIQRSLIIYSPHLKNHCQPCAQVLLHSFILSSYCPWVELPTPTFETLLLLTASSLPLWRTNTLTISSVKAMTITK